MYREAYWHGCDIPTPAFPAFVKNSKKGDIFTSEELTRLFNPKLYSEPTITKRGSRNNPKFRIVPLPDITLNLLKEHIAAKRIAEDDFIFKGKKEPDRSVTAFYVHDNPERPWIQQARRAAGNRPALFPGHGRPRDEELTRLRKERNCLVTTNSKHGLPVCAHILNREFQAERGGQKWASSYQRYAVIYPRIVGGRIFLTVVLDLYDRKIIGSFAGVYLYPRFHPA